MVLGFFTFFFFFGFVIGVGSIWVGIVVEVLIGRGIDLVGGEVEGGLWAVGLGGLM